MARSKLVDSIATRLGKPLLIEPSRLLPLDDLGSVVPALPRNVQAQPIDGALDDDSLGLANEVPSLIPSSVFLVLDDTLPLLVGRPGHIDDFI